MNIFGLELMGSQLLLSVLILFILLKTLYAFTSRQISRSFFILWISVWLSGLVVIYYPGLLTMIARFLNIGRGVDFALYVSVILIFYMIYKINLKIEKINREITKLVRVLAVNNKKTKLK